MQITDLRSIVTDVRQGALQIINRATVALSTGAKVYRRDIPANRGCGLMFLRIRVEFHLEGEEEGGKVVPRRSLEILRGMDLISRVSSSLSSGCPRGREAVRANARPLFEIASSREGESRRGLLGTRGFTRVSQTALRVRYLLTRGLLSRTPQPPFTLLTPPRLQLVPMATHLSSL